jgi:hypothetical protein
MSLPPTTRNNSCAICEDASGKCWQCLEQPRIALKVTLIESTITLTGADGKPLDDAAFTAIARFSAQRYLYLKQKKEGEA